MLLLEKQARAKRAKQPVVAPKVNITSSTKENHQQKTIDTEVYCLSKRG